MGILENLFVKVVQVQIEGLLKYYCSDFEKFNITKSGKTYRRYNRLIYRVYTILYISNSGVNFVCNDLGVLKETLKDLKGDLIK